MTTYEIPKINPADLAEHVGLNKQVLQDGQVFIFNKFSGPFHTEYGTSWLFGGELKNGHKFTCFLPDNNQREEQLSKLQQGKKYVLIKQSWKGFDDVIKSFYKFKAVNSW